MGCVQVLLGIYVGTGLNWIGLSFIRAGTDRIVDVTLSQCADLENGSARGS